MTQVQLKYRRVNGTHVNGEEVTGGKVYITPVSRWGTSDGLMTTDTAEHAVGDTVTLGAGSYRFALVAQNTRFEEFRIVPSTGGPFRIDQLTEFNTTQATASLPQWRAYFDDRIQQIILDGAPVTPDSIIGSTEVGRDLLVADDATVARTRLGLSAVNNTADIDKPISAATQSALDDKVDSTPALLQIGSLAPSESTILQVKAGAWNTRTPAQLRDDMGVAAGATANDTDANLKNRSNHTGNQAISTVSGLQTALDGLQSVRARTVSAYQHGVRADGVNRRTELLDAFAAAEAAGGGGCVELPSGTVRITGNLPLSGYSSGLIGSGSAAGTGLTTQKGTLLEFVSQTGPALDFTGFKYPRGQRGKVIFSDFALKGDGASGMKGILLDTGEGGSSGIDMARVVIYNTGGVGLHVKDHYLSEFNSIVVCDPVNSATSDIPWVLLEGANGNRYVGLGLRSLNFNDAVADTPPSGALRLITGTVFQHHRSIFVAPWFENLHVGQDSAMVVTQSNVVTFSDTEFFDCYRVVGTTGTAHFRVEAPAAQNYGGNIFRGIIPGKGSNGANEIEAGIDLRQSSNHIMGVKGVGGNNVLLASGVGYTGAILMGAEVPGNNSAFVDSSGVNTNTLIDMPQGTWVIGERPGGGYLRMAGAYQGDKVLDRGTITANTTFTSLFGQNIFTATLGANIAITAITANSSQVGRRITVVLTQDGTGSRTVTWPSNVKFAGGSSPTLSTAAGKIDSFTFIYNGTHWVESGRAIGA